LENTLTYQREKSRLLAHHRGEWVAIAKGEVVAVASSGVECIRRAEAQAPGVHHRFVFEVGTRPPQTRVAKVDVNECKDREECGNNLVNKIALGKLIDKAGGKLEDDFKNDRTCLTLKGKTKCWKWLGEAGKHGLDESGIFGFDQCIEMTLDQIGSKPLKTKKICALLDTGKRGPFMFMDPASFLAVAATAEDPDDEEQAELAGGVKIPVRHAFVSVEIPQVNFSIQMAYVGTNKTQLKELIDKQKQDEEKKKKPKQEEKKKPKD
jgi:hypothetical protein